MNQALTEFTGIMWHEPENKNQMSWQSIRFSFNQVPMCFMSSHKVGTLLKQLWFTFKQVPSFFCQHKIGKFLAQVWKARFYAFSWEAQNTCCVTISIKPWLSIPWSHPKVEPAVNSEWHFALLLHSQNFSITKLLILTSFSDSVTWVVSFYFLAWACEVWCALSLKCSFATVVV